MQSITKDVSLDLIFLLRKRLTKVSIENITAIT